MKETAAPLFERFLILRCQAGDEQALAELIARYSPGLRVYLRKMVQQPQTADDLLQDTWFDVYRKINALRQPDVFVSWLYRIARDKAYSVLRRRRIPLAGPDESAAENLPAQEESFTAEEAQAIRIALDALPAHHREVLVLRFVQDMTYDQIAQVIGKTVGTVRSRIHYARSALRVKLESKSIFME